MIDYHLHVNNITTARNTIRTYVEYIAKKYKKGIISFSQHEDLDLYRSYPIIDYGKRFGITIVESVSFRSSDGIELNVLNPNKQVDELLDDCIKEKTNRIIHILQGLSTYGIYITPKQVIDKMNKTDLVDLHLANDDIILQLMMDLNFCENENVAYNSYLKNVIVPRIFPSTKQLIEKLQGNNVYINNYKEYREYVYKTGDDFVHNINGFIIDDFIEIDTSYKNGSVERLYGSGKTIE